ncbi:MAG TPA: glycosyltransferase, partial [Thermoleophilaceae bacterium]|nr:glycosyltransferase [Thermoleophilaceae bacterium]
AAAYPGWHEPQALALYRARPGSLIAGSMRSGRNVRDARRTIDLMSGSVPPASRPTAVRAARARCAGWALKNASMLLERQDLRGVLAQGREALASDPREVARSLAVGGVRRLSNVTVEPLELGPALDPAPRPSSNRRPIARYVGSEPRPLWSVMIPAYECADYLRQTLASVLAQDPGPELMQIEVVDDASSDEPEKVVEELGAGRVSFHRQPRNVGHIANFNTCLERSRGALVHLLHGDDCVRNGFYQTMQQPFTQHEEIGAAFCRYIAMDEQGHWTNLAPLELRSAGVLPGWLGRIAVGQRLQTPSMVVRREVYEQLGGFDSRVGFAEDWAMWVKVAAHYPVAYEPEPLALYRVHTSSMTGRYLRDGENVRDLRRVIETNREQLPPELADEITRMALRETATTCLRRAQRMLGAGDAEAMWAQVREAIRSDHSPRIVASAGVVVAARAALGAVGAVRAGHARLV